MGINNVSEYWGIIAPRQEESRARANRRVRYPPHPNMCTSTIILSFVENAIVDKSREVFACSLC